MNTFIRQTAERQTEQNIYREVKYTKIHDTINTIASPQTPSLGRRTAKIVIVVPGKIHLLRFVWKLIVWKQDSRTLTQASLTTSAV